MWVLLVNNKIMSRGVSLFSIYNDSVVDMKRIGYGMGEKLL